MSRDIVELRDELIHYLDNQKQNINQVLFYAGQLYVGLPIIQGTVGWTPFLQSILIIHEY